MAFAVTFGVTYNDHFVGPFRLSETLRAAAMFGGVTGILSMFLHVERRLTFSGTRRRGPHKGLFSLTGHSRRFTETIERIIHGGF